MQREFLGAGWNAQIAQISTLSHYLVRYVTSVTSSSKLMSLIFNCSFLWTDSLGMLFSFLDCDLLTYVCMYV